MNEWAYLMSQLCKCLSDIYTPLLHPPLACDKLERVSPQLQVFLRSLSSPSQEPYEYSCVLLWLAARCWKQNSLLFSCGTLDGAPKAGLRTVTLYGVKVCNTFWLTEKFLRCLICVSPRKLMLSLINYLLVHNKNVSLFDYVKSSSLTEIFLPTRWYCLLHSLYYFVVLSRCPVFLSVRSDAGLYVCSVHQDLTVIGQYRFNVTSTSY